MESLKTTIIAKNNLDLMFDHVQHGGIEIIENSTPLGVEFALHSIIEYSRHKGIPLIVEDIFDTLAVYLSHLNFMGINFEDSDIKVIKVSGGQEVGKVLARIRFENNPYVYRKKIDQELDRVIPEGKYIHLVLGLERLISLQNDPHTVRAILSLMKEKLSEERGMSIYIIEKSLVENLPLNPLPLMENVATSVIELTGEKRELIKIRLKKSRLALLAHTEYLFISPREVLRWWG